MSSTVDDLQRDFVVAVSVLGGVNVLLLCGVVGLYVWNFILTKRLKALEPFVNFKLQRPKLYETSHPAPEIPSHAYDNSGYERRDLNPIAIRSKASFDNGNFIIGNPNKLASNSFRSPDYLDLDSRFY
ncbi:unnamed protein product [Tenebrio molitor]|jgi:hypothetical protein|nr:unnamed protein product [Tenebrio molitor]